jgi:cbb3-type cytochrome c oxidase subunit III
MYKLAHFLLNILLLTLITAVVMAAEPPKPGKAAKIDVAKLYTENCAICHGDSGDGNTRAKDGLRPPPRNFTTVEAALELTRERMIKSVTEGRPGTAMMSHKDRLSPAEIEAVVDYIRERFMRTPDEITPQMAKKSEGRQIFEQNCAVCHGDKGNTAVWARSGLKPPPRDFTTDEAARILTRDRMIHSVTNGRPGTGMMPFKTNFNDKQIAAVVDYIRGTFMRPEVAKQNSAEKAAESSAVQAESAVATPGKHATVASSTALHEGPHAGMPGMMRLPGSGAMPSGHVIDADMSLPLPNGLKGDIQWGREFFMKNCFACHGIKGDGKGPRASFNIPRPRNFTSEESRRILNRPRIFNSITHGRVGSVMPAWGKVLNQQQVADLAEFVFEAFIQPDKYHALTTTTEQPEKKKAP